LSIHLADAFDARGPLDAIELVHGADTTVHTDPPASIPGLLSG
jgi:hypothetical protein